MANGRSAGTDLGLLVLRLALGGVFIAHGVAKFQGQGIEGFEDELLERGVPESYSYAASLATIASEVAGGLVVVLGLGFFGRIGALALATTMGFAMALVTWQNGFFLPRSVESAGPVPWGFEYNLVLLCMALCVVFAGPGSFGLFSGGKKGSV